MKTIRLISKRVVPKEISQFESPVIYVGETKKVSLHKIRKEIPKEALDPEEWGIPEGFYAIEEKD